MTGPDDVEGRGRSREGRQRGEELVDVDDAPDLRSLLTLALADEGYEVRAAPDGRVALDLLEAWPPRVILLDLLMPTMDSWAFRAR